MIFFRTKNIVSSLLPPLLFYFSPEGKRLDFLPFLMISEFQNHQYVECQDSSTFCSECQVQFAPSIEHELGCVTSFALSPMFRF